MANESFLASSTDNLIEAIKDSVKTEVINVGGEEFTTRKVFRVDEKAHTKRLDVKSLDGLVEYLNENVDKHEAENLIILVKSPKTVSVLSQVGENTEQRTNWLDADYDLIGFTFNRYIDHETFMIEAQSLIVNDLDRAKLLEYIGNLTTAHISTSTDDGISQTVVVEKGVRKSEVELPNPVRLRPRRTFVEIVHQPASNFVLRLRQTGEGKMPEIALFEADGGLWKLEAVKSIKNYITENLNEDLNIPVIG